jgi:hypothetical protein
MDLPDIRALLRSSIEVEGYGSANAVIEAIIQGFSVLRVTDRRPESERRKLGGYADVLVNVRTPNGTIAEIQINTPPMLAAKENQGHKVYDAARSLPETDPKCA